MQIPQSDGCVRTRFRTRRQELLLSRSSSLPARSGRFGAAETSLFPAGRNPTFFAKKPLLCLGWATESGGGWSAVGTVVPPAHGHPESPERRVWLLGSWFPVSIHPRQTGDRKAGLGRGAAGSAPGDGAGPVAAWLGRAAHGWAPTMATEPRSAAGAAVGVRGLNGAAGCPAPGTGQGGECSPGSSTDVLGAG